jgi:hypothetical protein
METAGTHDCAGRVTHDLFRFFDHFAELVRKESEKI